MSLDLEIFFKEECGISYSDLRRENEKYIREINSKFEESVLRTSGYANGFHKNQTDGKESFFPYNWDKIAELEADGVGDMLDPWLPAPCERVGKSWLELNIMANERKNNFLINKTKG